MNVYAACVSAQHYPPPAFSSSPRHHTVRRRGSLGALLKQIPVFKLELKCILPSFRGGVLTGAGNLNSSRKLGFRVDARNVSGEPFRGKSGSVSFRGFSHQSVEESKLVSAPFKENTGSLLWILAPAALISAFIVPQFFIVSAIEDVFRNETFAEILSSFSTEVLFYAGLAIFLFVAERIQKPYLEFSSKRWSLINGLKGSLTFAIFTMGLKVFAPIIAVHITWPVLRLSALVSVAPFLFGCLAQYAFEKRLELKGSSCWPLVPIIFEVYRIYQLMRATSFIEKLVYGLREASATPAVLDRTGALISMIVIFRVLGLVCLWSLLTFLLRLFPSRPVAENY